MFSVKSLNIIDTSILLLNDPTITEIYTLSLHDALPIFTERRERSDHGLSLLNPYHDYLLSRWNSGNHNTQELFEEIRTSGDRKSTRLNSSHSSISYAVFCLKKKITRATTTTWSALL